MTEARTISLTVGTAGHIDHGKTELVKYLTGCNCDRLPEEKARGMTIDLGFATCELPDHRQVGVVDVPGHERFIHNMVAGASGMDVVILVIAADDGVMPQTIEHFHIVRMLGVQSGMVVVTKTDLVDESRVAEVKQQARELVAGSMLDGCPVVGFSSRTGAGFDDFHTAFMQTVDRTAERNSDGAFRMHVERSFVLKGLGTIISGIPRSGRVRLGDTLELLPAGEEKRVRGIQVYGRDSSQGLAGECVALRMGDTSKESVTRGMVLAEKDFFSPSLLINVRLQVLPGLTKALRPRTAIRFHTGTSDVPGHLVLPTLEPLPPGGESYVQLQLKRPVVAAPGDFFVVRTLSPTTTVGGGYVVSSVSVKLRRSREDWAQECREREEAFREPETRLEYVLRQSCPEIMTLRKLAHLCFLNEDAVRKHSGPLLEAGKAVELSGGRFVYAAALEDAKQELTTVLNSFHDEHRVSLGFQKKDVFRKIETDRLLVDRALEELMSAGIVAMGDAGLYLAARAASLSPGQQRVADKIEKLYLDTAFASPREDELPLKIGAPGAVLTPILKNLLQRGILVRIDDKVILHKDHLDESRELLVKYIESNGSIESGAFRDLIGATRKYSIPILEYWDAQKLTKRVGNERVLR